MSKNNIPRHVAIIMDGNGRWAKKRGLPRIAGHKAGRDSVKAIIRSCSQKGIEVLTLFAFSSENWQRPQKEVNFLMDLFLNALHNEVLELQQNNIQLRIIGDRLQLDRKLQKAISQSEEITAKNTGLKLIIAINYSGRWDLVNAMQKIAAQTANGSLPIFAISDTIIANNLSTHDLPEPDLLIRTSGELRISNFMLWQLAYTELYFTDTLWPDFREKEFELALQDFATRERRFGKA